MHYVIIGNSIAATAAIEGIRSQDRQGKITVISEEKDHVYGRPLISYWLEKKVSEQQMPYRDPEFYQEQNVEVLLGVKATSVSFDKKTVKLSNKKELTYDKLLISTGGKPIVPPIPGLTAKNHSCFYNYEDVRQLNQTVQPGQHVLVLGGGLTGLKAAESLHRLGVKVSLIELADRLLGTIMDHDGSEMVASFIKSQGVDLYLGNTITQINSAKNGLSQFILKDGTTLEAKLLIMAIGVTPRTDFLKDSNLTINRGILASATQATNFPDVYVAGDVAEVPDLLTGKTVVAPILPNAFTQGRIAGINMTGGTASFEGSLAYNAIGFLGMHTVSMGQSTLETSNEYEVLKQLDQTKQTYRKIVLQNNRLIGALFIGEIGRAGLYQDLIRNQVDVSSFKDQLLANDFKLLNLPSTVYQSKLAE